MSLEEIYVDGISVLTLSATVADVSWSELADGGCDVASFTLPDVSTIRSTSRLGAGAQIDIVLNGDPLFTGDLNEFTPGAQTFTAAGPWRQAEHTATLDVMPIWSPISIPDIAVSAAVARGALDWVYRGGLSEDGYTSEDTTQGLNYLNTLLDATEGAAGRRWGVGPRREFYTRADPSEPKWMLSPGTEALGSADGDYRTHLYGPYVSGVTEAPETPGVPNAWATVLAANAYAASRPGRRREEIVDLRVLGQISQSRAQEVVDGKLAMTGPRRGYTEGYEASPLILSSIGGTVADPRLVRAGDVCRVQGLITGNPDIAASGYEDFVIGEVRHRGGDEVVSIIPVGFVPRSVSSLLSVSAPADPITA